MKSLALLLATCTCLVHCLPPPHPDVVALRHEEELLHPLQRSPALRNPHLLKILPLTSLLHEGENLVFDRKANEIPREQIYKVLTHAGLIPRSAFSQSSEHNQIADIFSEVYWPELSYISTQDALQHL